MGLWQAPAGGVDAAQLRHACEAAARQVEAPVDLHLRHVGRRAGHLGLQPGHLGLQPGRIGLQHAWFVTSSAARCWLRLLPVVAASQGRRRRSSAGERWPSCLPLRPPPLPPLPPLPPAIAAVVAVGRVQLLGGSK